jgi:hypothetical protein
MGNGIVSIMTYHPKSGVRLLLRLRRRVMTKRKAFGRSVFESIRYKSTPAGNESKQNTRINSEQDNLGRFRPKACNS